MAWLIAADLYCRPVDEQKTAQQPEVPATRGLLEKNVGRILFAESDHGPGAHNQSGKKYPTSGREDENDRLDSLFCRILNKGPPSGISRKKHPSTSNLSCK